VELHRSSRGRNAAPLERRLHDAVARLAAALGDDVVSTDGTALEAPIGRELAMRGWRIGVAESCIGGLVTSRLTDTADAGA